MVRNRILRTGLILYIKNLAEVQRNIKYRIVIFMFFLFWYKIFTIKTGIEYLPTHNKILYSQAYYVIYLYIMAYLHATTRHNKWDIEWDTLELYTPEKKLPAQ